MNQALMNLQAEIKNTRALENLNQTVLRLIASNLRDDFDVQRIREESFGMDDETIRRTYGGQAANKFFASRQVENSLSQSGNRSSALEKALELQKASGGIDREALRIAAAKDGFSKLELQMLEEVMKGKRDVLDIERDIENQIIKNNNARAREGVDLSGNLRAGIGNLRSQSDQILNDLANNAPARFADGMANAMSEVAEGTKSIGDAFADMAIDFGRMLQQEVFRALARRAVGSLMGNLLGATSGSQKGGIIKAQNGMYISGGRTGDRNLALLEDGEYVLNRNAVQMMGGPKGLDKLNFNMAPRFASGGGFSMAPGFNQNQEYDDTFLLNNQSTGKIDSSMFSAFAYDNDPYFQDVRQKAQRRFERRVQKRFEKRQKRAQLISSIVGAAGSMFMAAGLSGMGGTSASGAQGKTLQASGQLKGATPKIDAALSEAASKGNYSFGRFLQKNSASLNLNGVPLQEMNAMSKLSAQGFMGPLSPAEYSGRLGSFQHIQGGKDMSSRFSQAGAKINNNKTGIFQNLFSSARNIFSRGKSRNQIGGLIGYNSGGFIPYGSRLNDTIPAMLTGGEYVMNNKAVSKYGLSTMNKMNSGSFQYGGEAGSNTTSNNTNNNSTNIAINIDRSGNAVYGSNSSSYEQNDIVISKEMARQINSIVLKNISNEKRYGGELHS